MGINCTKLPKVRPQQHHNQQVESRATAVDSVSRRASVAGVKMEGNISNFGWFELFFCSNL